MKKFFHYRVANMPPELRDAILSAISSEIIKGKQFYSERHFKGMKNAGDSILEGKEWISEAQLRTIEMVLNRRYGNKATEIFRKFIESNKKLNVFLGLGD